MPQVLDRETSRHESDTAIQVPEKTGQPEPSTVELRRRPIKWIVGILGLVAVVMVGVFIFDMIADTTTTADEPAAVMSEGSGSSAGERTAVIPQGSGSSAGEPTAVTSDGSYEANELRRMLGLAPEGADG